MKTFIFPHTVQSQTTPKAVKHDRPKFPRHLMTPKTTRKPITVEDGLLEDKFELRNTGLPNLKPKNKIGVSERTFYRSIEFQKRFVESNASSSTSIKTLGTFQPNTSQPSFRPLNLANQYELIMSKIHTGKYDELFQMSSQPFDQKSPMKHVEANNHEEPLRPYIIESQRKLAKPKSSKVKNLNLGDKRMSNSQTQMSNYGDDVNNYKNFVPSRQIMAKVFFKKRPDSKASPYNSDWKQSLIDSPARAYFYDKYVSANTENISISSPKSRSFMVKKKVVQDERAPSKETIYSTGTWTESPDSNNKFSILFARKSLDIKRPATREYMPFSYLE